MENTNKNTSNRRLALYISIIVLVSTSLVALIVLLSLQKTQDYRSEDRLGSGHSRHVTNAPTLAPSSESSILYYNPKGQSTLRPTSSRASSSTSESMSSTTTKQQQEEQQQDSSSATSCPPPSPIPFPGKKGAAFTLRPNDGKSWPSWVQNLPKVVALKPSWNYSWGLNRIDAQPVDLEWVPMVWGGGMAATELQATLQELKSTMSVQRLFGFNEPDKADQANMPVQDAIRLWPVLESAGLPLVSPSCVHPSGAWMEEFMAAVDAQCLRVDYIGVHWYGGVNVDNFKQRMRNHYEKWKRPLVITEFAPADWDATTVENNKFTRAQVLSFMKQVLPWLEQQDWIAAYAWFPFKPSWPAGTCSSLFEADGSLTELGQFYASVTTENPYGDQSITVG